MNAFDEARDALRHGTPRRDVARRLLAEALAMQRGIRELSDAVPALTDQQIQTRLAEIAGEDHL